MEALKLIQTTQDGILRIEVPEHFKNTELEVIVIPLEEKKNADENRLQQIRQYFGTAKFPDAVVNEDDLYKQ